MEPVDRLTSAIHSSDFINDIRLTVANFGVTLTSMLRNFMAANSNVEFGYDDPGKSYKVTKEGYLGYRSKSGKKAYAKTTIELTIGPTLSEKEYEEITEGDIQSLT